MVKMLFNAVRRMMGRNTAPVVGAAPVTKRTVSAPTLAQRLGRTMATASVARETSVRPVYVDAYFRPKGVRRPSYKRNKTARRKAARRHKALSH